MRDGDQAEPDDDRSRHFQRHKAEHHGQDAGGAKQQRDQAIEHGVAGAGAIGLVRGMAQVERGGEGTTQASGSDCAQSVHQERGFGCVVITGNFDAFQNHEGSQGIQRGQGNNDGEIGPIGALVEEGKYIHCVGQIEFHRRQRGYGKGVDVEPAQHCHQYRAESDSKKSRRHMIGESETGAVEGEEDQHGEQSDGRLLEDAEDEAQAKISQRKAGQRGEERGARRAAAQPIGA